MSDLEKFLAALTSGNTENLPEPNTNVEKYLAKALGVWDGELPKPLSRADCYFLMLAENGAGGGGGADDATLATLKAIIEESGGELVIPANKGIEIIGDFAFYKSAFTGVGIPAGVKSIGWSAFDRSALVSIRTPASCTDIKEYAFWENLSLKDVQIDGPAVIGHHAFGVETTNKYAFDSFVAPEVVELCDYALYHRKFNFEELTLQKVKKLGNYALDTIKGLKRLILPSAEETGELTFQSASVEFVSMPAIKRIGYRSFLSAALSSVELGDTIERIDASAFYKTKLTEIHLPEGLTGLYQNAFGDTLITKLDLPHSLVAIGDYAFENMGKLTELTLNEEVTNPGKYLCKSCGSLTTLNYNAINATNTHGSRILDATKLTQLNIGPKVETIVQSLCYNCTSLPIADIPANVQAIGDSSFGTCSALKIFIVRGERTCALLGTNAFKNTPIASGTGYIYVEGSVEDYRAATNWVAHASQIFPFVKTVEDLANIDGATYARAFVDSEYCAYIYDGAAWSQEVTE